MPGPHASPDDSTRRGAGPETPPSDQGGLPPDRAVSREVVASDELEAAGDASSRVAEGAVAHVHETWAIEAAAAVLCRRWKPSILWALGAGPRRYNALAAALPHVTPKVLTEQLRELTRDGLVARSAQQSGPKHVEYTLTAAGAEMLPTLKAMNAWGRAWAGGARG